MVVGLLSVAALAMGFSEGMKGCTRVADSVYFAAHHDGNAIIRLTNQTTTIVIGSPLGEPGDSDGVGLNARLHGPQGIVYDGNRTVYFTDTFNGKLKSFDTELMLVASCAYLIYTLDELLDQLLLHLAVCLLKLQSAVCLLKLQLAVCLLDSYYMASCKNTGQQPEIQLPPLCMLTCAPIDAIALGAGHARLARASATL